MLAQKYRFHGRSSLRRVYRHGTTVRSRALAVRFAPNTYRVDSRCSVVVARKVIKSAPKRNRVRRRIYEIVRNQWPQILPGKDFIITVYEPNLYDIPHNQLQHAVIQLLDRAGILSRATKP